jgi:acyl-CoA thioester hydrolase
MSVERDPFPGGSADYGQVLPVRINFDDLDSLGVVHNARYSLLFERALIKYWLDRGWHFDAKRSVMPDTLQVVSEFRIRYHLPITSIGDVSVHFWLEKVNGYRSTYGFRFISLDSQTTYAEGHRIQVRLDPVTLSPIPYSDKSLDMSRVLMRPQGVAPTEREPLAAGGQA